MLFRSRTSGGARESFQKPPSILLECASVRAPVILLITLALAAQAETIHLKNGRTILASNVREKNGRIEWEVGDNTYSIAKALVERIDTGGAPAVTRGSAEEIEVAPPTEQVEHAEELSGRVVVQDRKSTRLNSSHIQKSRMPSSA